MAVVMMTAKATMPMNMLGKPNTELCGVCITSPQETNGFTSHTVTWLGSLRTSSFSSTRIPEASQPTTPVINSSHAKGLSRTVFGRESCLVDMSSTWLVALLARFSLAVLGIADVILFDKWPGKPGRALGRIVTPKAGRWPQLVHGAPRHSDLPWVCAGV